MQIDSIISKLKDVDHYRIFVQENNIESLNVKDGEIETIAETQTNGVSVFYIKDKLSYFYSTNSEDNLKNFSLVDAKKMPKNIDYKFSESGIVDDVQIGKKSRLSMDDFARDFADATKPKDKRILTNIGRYNYIESSRRILTNTTDVKQKIYRGFGMFSSSAKEGNKIRNDYTRLGLSTALNKRVYDIIDDNSKMNKSLIEKLRFKDGFIGKLDVILDPDLSDLLAHEAIGHATESDLVYNGFSALKGKLGKTLAPKFINLLDDPTPKDDLFGSFYYDDEGFRAKKKYLIKEGKLNDFILSSKYASLMGLENNGSARSMSYDYTPIPRMSNTSFEPKNHSIDEMISQTKDGILLSHGSGGQVDPATGVFQFGVKEGYRIKNGEIVDKYVNLTFGGNILDSLKNIVAISKENKLNQPGFCGKDSQSVPVGGFGPYLKLENIRLG